MNNGIENAEKYEYMIIELVIQVSSNYFYYFKYIFKFKV